MSLRNMTLITNVMTVGFAIVGTHAWNSSLPIIGKGVVIFTISMAIGFLWMFEYLSLPKATR